MHKIYAATLKALFEHTYVHARGDKKCLKDFGRQMAAVAESLDNERLRVYVSNNHALPRVLVHGNVCPLIPTVSVFFSCAHGYMN